MRFPDDLWFDIGKDPRGLLFFDRAHARGLTKDKPEFDQRTRDAASLATLLNALAPRDFITFGSPQTIAHSGLTGFGVLEGFPHNKVHNCVGGIFKDSNGMTTDVGGFMQANLSPVDPLFMLHHANIDRIWDVWTRKQQASNQPTLPSGVDASGNPIVDKWKSERFVFFVDNKGKPVTKTTAGDYAEIGEFNYDYEPGSGEEVVPVRVAAAPAAPVERFGVTGTGGRLTLPAALLRSEQNAPPPRLFAKVTLDLPPSAHQGVSVDIDGTTFDLSMFGHHTIQAPVTFTLPLTAPLANRNNTLNFSVASSHGHAAGGSHERTRKSGGAVHCGRAALNPLRCTTICYILLWSPPHCSASLGSSAIRAVRERRNQHSSRESNWYCRDRLLPAKPSGWKFGSEHLGAATSRSARATGG